MPTADDSHGEPARPEWLLLDIGGVLEIVDDAAWPAAWSRRWAARLGLTEDAFAAATESPLLPDMSTSVGVEVAYWAALGSALAATPEQTAALRADFWDEYCGSENVELMTALRRVSSRVRLAILSNSADGAREEEESRYGFSALFDPIVYSHEIGVMKPDPAAFGTVLSRMSAEPSSVLFIDDWPANVEAARSLGMRAHLHVGNRSTITAIQKSVGGAVGPRR